MVELLAPGGNINNVKLAFAVGADAVYVGMKQFSARNKCDNFDYENLEEILLIARLQGKKVYVALNTIIKDSELDAFFEAVKICEKLRVDGLILQDLFLGKFLRDSGCSIDLHASTQSGICSVASAKVAESFGFSRVILSRETSISEIRKIKSQTSLEIEYFVQGAMCVCFSGNCYFSSAIDGNSGNRGKCFQPCRKKYALKCGNIKREGFLISPKDLCLDDHIEKLISAGVCSFKIEGRLRRTEYVGASVAHYRKIIDKMPVESSKRDLMVAFNRGNYTTGYADARKTKIIDSNIQNHIGVEIGKIARKTGKSTYFVESKYSPSIGDGFKFLLDSKEVGGCEHQKGLKQTAYGFEIFSNLAVIGAKVCLTTDKLLETKYAEYDCKIPLDIEYTAKTCQKILLKLSCGEFSYEYTSEFATQKADKIGLQEDRFQKSISKLGDTIFKCGKISGHFDRDIFMGISQINEMRRLAIDGFICYIKGQIQSLDVAKNYGKVARIKENTQSRTAVIFDEHSNCQTTADISIFKPTNYADIHEETISKQNGDIYLYIPCFFDSEDVEVMENLYRKHNFSGLYIENYGGLALGDILGGNVIIGEKLNISNSISYSVANEYASDICWSKELAMFELPCRAGFLLAHGGFEIMTYAHCPLIANDICICGSCKYQEGMKYTDENGRDFQLKRMKIAQCQFNLYYDQGIDIREEATGFGKLLDYTVSCGGYSAINSARGVK